MTRRLEFGELVEVDGVWLVCKSWHDPFNSTLHRWRSGERCVIPELVDVEAERKLRHAPPPPPPDPPRFITVRARA